MNPIVISLISFATILSGALLGFYLGRRLPVHHLNADSKDAVKMTWGIIATMSALVLGLMIASAKNTFDAVSLSKTEGAAKLIVLDKVLKHYGPEAQSIRADLRDAVASAIKRDWPEEQIDSPVPAATEDANVMDTFADKLDQLTPANESQHSSLERARQLTNDLALRRWMIIEQSKAILPNVLFVALVFWLTVLFLGLGVFAPRNKTVLATTLLGTLSVSLAIYIISDMSHPLKGLITVSSSSMLDVWARLDH